MSSSQQTTNLGLPIYGDSDVPNWKDTNAPFQTLDDIIGQGGTGGGSQVQLDFANPLYTFRGKAMPATYTATQDCWLFGNIGSSWTLQVPTITIDGTLVFSADQYFNSTNQSAGLITIPPLRVAKGSVIVVNGKNDAITLGVFKGSVVSSEVTVFNEAELTFDYANPLHSFTSNNLTYTATKRCWLIGALSNQRTITINGTYISEGMASATTELCLPLSKGDVVVCNQENLYLHVYDATISGSVGSIGEPVFDFAHPVFTFQNSTGHTSYTADHDCWLVGTFGMAALGNCDLLIDGTSIAHARYNAEACNIPIQYKILSGSTVSLSGATASLYGTLHILNEV